MPLKVVLFAHSMSIVSGRNIERACREHVTFIALSGGSGPHFTLFAGFVSTLGDDIARVLSPILFTATSEFAGLAITHPAPTVS